MHFDALVYLGRRASAHEWGISMAGRLAPLCLLAIAFPAFGAPPPDNVGIELHRAALTSFSSPNAQHRMSATLFRGEFFISDIFSLSPHAGRMKTAKLSHVRTDERTRGEVLQPWVNVADVGYRLDAWEAGCDLRAVFDFTEISAGLLYRKGHIVSVIERAMDWDRTVQHPPAAPAWKNEERVGTMDEVDLRLAIGKRWSWKGFTLGVDWFVALVPAFRRRNLDPDLDRKAWSLDGYESVRHGLYEWSFGLFSLHAGYEL